MNTNQLAHWHALHPTYCRRTDAATVAVTDNYGNVIKTGFGSYREANYWLETPEGIETVVRFFNQRDAA